MDYFGAADADSYGKLHSVTPPYTFNPVVSEYTYDGYGQPKDWREGPPSGPNLTQPISAVTGFTGYGPDGWLKGGCNGGDCFDFCDFDDAGNVQCVHCTGSATLENDETIQDCFPASCPTTQPCDACDLPIYTMATKPPMSSGCTDGSILRNPNGEITRLPKCAVDGIIPSISGQTHSKRTHDMAYDELGRLRSVSILSTEATATGAAGPGLTRTFTYNPESTTGHFTRTGPDGTATEVWLDEAGRVQTFVRKDAANNQFMSATVSYDAADRVTLAAYGNGTQTRYEYDDANRLTKIRHEQGAGTLIHQLEYFWTADGLVSLVFDTDENNSASLLRFFYDQRNRLIREWRTGSYPYHIAYTYDRAGNRTSKAEGVGSEIGGSATTYTYDVEDPGHYGSQGNRLVHERREWGFQQNSGRDRWYLYDKSGRVNYVIRRADGDTDEVSGRQWYTGTQLWYNTQGLVWLAWEIRWLQNANGSVDNNSVVYNSAMEYRYDSARGRYRVQRRDPRKKLPNGQSNDPSVGGTFLYPWSGTAVSASAGVWSDYDGDSIHSDYNVALPSDPPVLTVPLRRAHEPGLAQSEFQVDGSVVTSYLHGNLIGTTERMTNSSGAIAHRAVFTAFGEPVYEGGTTDTRYGYAGAWGYQEGGGGDPLADLGWLHVGARYYDPSSGRFVQRDPMGIVGGSNSYEYVVSGPTDSVDPFGLDRWIVGTVHQAVVFGNSKTGYRRLEIGAYDGRHASKQAWYWRPFHYVGTAVNLALCATVGGIGVVTKTSDTRPSGPPDLITTPAQDDALDKEYQDGDPVIYNVLYRNCIEFARIRGLER